MGNNIVQNDIITIYITNSYKQAGDNGFGAGFSLFESFRDFIDDVFNPSEARVKNIINKVEKTREM